MPNNFVPKPSKKIILKSSDGKTFDVEEAIALKSQTLKCMIEGNSCTYREIPLPIARSNILAKVIDYCKKHVEAASSDKGRNSSKKKNYYKDNDQDDALKAWDAEFISELDQETLFHLILAANYLGIKSLVDLAQQTAWGMIRPKTTKEIRKIYDKNYTSEDEFHVEYQWVWSDTKKSFSYSFML